MQYTGIRAVPRVTPRRIMQPHLARYKFATEAIDSAAVAVDIACGTGYGVSLLKSGGCGQVWGVDLDWEPLAYARSTFGVGEGTHLVQGDGVALPMADHSVDVVTCFETFEHILDSQRFLGEICRILAPRGALLISAPNARLWAPFGRSPNLELDYIRLGLGHKYNFSARGFLNLLSAYFDIVIPFGQDFRRDGLASRLTRQLERVIVYLKYRAAEMAPIRKLLAPALGDVLLQTDLRFDDRRWEVKRWDRKDTEPLFCLALCRGARSGV